MALTLITPPTDEPLSLAEVKAHCRVLHSEEDATLAGYLLAARMHAEGYTRRAFVTQTRELALDDWPRINRDSPRARIWLPKAPLQSVTSVTYTDSTGVTRTLSSSLYRALGANQERAEGYIDAAYGVTLPTVRSEAESIRVRFVCGYSAVLKNSFPQPIRQAMLMLVDWWYEQREAVNVGNIVTEVPHAVEALLFPYRLFY